MAAKVKQFSAVSRRDFLRHMFYAGAAVGTPPMLAACGSSGGGNTTAPVTTPPPVDGTVREISIPVGPLADIGDLQPVNVDDLMLPPGFTSRVVADQGLNPVSGVASLTDYNWHRFPDGGATYERPNGGWVYTSNSEFLGAPQGGVGTLVFDPPEDENSEAPIVGAFPILEGTTQNCAGGKTPWGTWVSSEETGSGLNWETDPMATNPAGAVAKPALGMFAHEAIAVDMENRTIYETEDSGSGRFYRWVADETDVFMDGNVERLRMETGELQVMNVAGFADGGDSGSAPDEEFRQLRAVEWVPAGPIDEPQGSNRGPGTVFDGGEGLWFYTLPEDMRSVPPGGTRPSKGLVFFTTKGDNRVWAFDVENQMVETIFDNSQIDPGFSDVDNLTVTQAGDIIVAEDNPDTGVIRIMVVVPNQPAKVLVQLGQTHTGSEICGPAFSPDGSRLYFSSQRGGPSRLGRTFEVTLPPEFRPTAEQIAARRAG